MASYAREPRAYELMVILLPELAEDDLSGASDRVSKYITDASGAIKETLSDSPWGRRRLAYTIR
ncbi:MAG: 30S ribosomal protein S6, partial [Chloroflexia bacterium]|nr:30S ribosomal protein S6 [Chloroflexia bacterium]